MRNGNASEHGAVKGRKEKKERMDKREERGRGRVGWGERERGKRQ